MSITQHAETEKDKRLLVLLAFGVLILLFRVPALFPDRPQEQQAWGWVEGAGEGDVLRRVLLPGSSPTVGALPAGVQRGKGDYSLVSPRLAFLLGLPFPVNRASLDELTLLEGIGPKLAASIVDYRTRHGRINDARQLLAVPGIGERLAARLAPQFTFE